LAVGWRRKGRVTMATGGDMAAAVMAPYFCHGCVGEKKNDVQFRVSELQRTYFMSK
jgi:hypothetical protein